MYGNSITHEGVIENISDNKLFIRLSRLPACADCHAKGICSVPDSADGEVMVADEETGIVQGDHVVVSITRSHAYRALLLGYVLPFVLVLTTMILFTAFQVKEWIAALISLSILIPYYLIIRQFSDRIDRSFNFNVNKPV